MAKSPNWTADEVADLRTIAADTTLTWAEVATALAARVSAIGAPRSAMSCILLCRRLESK